MHLLPIAWQYFKEIMSMIQVNVRNGIRTEKVILPQLMKASIKHKVIIEKITISTMGFAVSHLVQGPKTRR